MLITITTGVRFANDYPDQCTATVFSVQAPDQELDPEAVWRAGNRIDDLEADCANLATGWQRSIRRALDTAESPSISVGDTVELCTDTGQYLGGWLCASVGWTPIVGSVADHATLTVSDQTGGSQ